MSSINLLPKNIKFKADLVRSEKNNTAFVISLLMIVFSIASFFGLYLSNYYALKKNGALNFQVKAANEEIEKKISDNRFLIAETKAKKNNLLLTKHTYFTKALNLIRNNLIAGVYLDELSVIMEEGVVVFELNGVSRDYQFIVSQMHIFKDLPYVESVDVMNVSVNDEGYEDFEAILIFKEDVLFYEN